MKTLVHTRVSSRLEAITSTRSGSYIFHGPGSVGKATAAYEVAKRANCRGDKNKLCSACHLFEAGAYPDLIIVRPEEKPSITIEQIRTVVQGLGLSPYYAGGVRCVLIDDAHKLTVDAQNALLKLIEEPPPDTLFILITQRHEALLPTVRSRCVSLYFPRLNPALIANWLEKGTALKPHEAKVTAEASEGLPGLAYVLSITPQEALVRHSLIEMAASVPTLGTFQRLLLARRLYDEKQDIPRFGEALHATLASMVQAGNTKDIDAPRQFAALERFRKHLQAGVMPRVALEALLVEL